MKKVIIILLVFMLSLSGCSKKVTIKNDQSNSDSNDTKIKKCNKNSSTEILEDVSINNVTSEYTSSPFNSPVNQVDDSSEVSTNTTFEIETITLKNLVNFTGRYYYDTPLDQEYTGERTEFHGERLYANINFSEEIVNTNYEEIIKLANPNIKLKTYLVEGNLLTIGIALSIDDTEQREIDIILPKEISSNSGNTLVEDTIIKLKVIPHLSVKVVSDNKNFPFSKDKTFNNYFASINKNMSYSFSLIFNGAVDKDSVLATVSSTFSELQPEYTWLSDRELKISFNAVKERLTKEINLSSALDANNNRLYTTLLIVIDVDEQLSFD